MQEVREHGENDGKTTTTVLIKATLVNWDEAEGGTVTVRYRRFAEWRSLTESEKNDTEKLNKLVARRQIQVKQDLIWQTVSKTEKNITTRYKQQWDTDPDNLFQTNADVVESHLANTVQVLGEFCKIGVERVKTKLPVKTKGTLLTPASKTSIVSTKPQEEASPERGGAVSEEKHDNTSSKARRKRENSDVKEQNSSVTENEKASSGGIMIRRRLPTLSPYEQAVHDFWQEYGTIHGRRLTEEDIPRSYHHTAEQVIARRHLIDAVPTPAVLATLFNMSDEEIQQRDDVWYRR